MSENSFPIVESSAANLKMKYARCRTCCIRLCWICLGLLALWVGTSKGSKNGPESMSVWTSDRTSAVCRPELETDLFRVVQEGLTNIMRHSGSKTAVIRLEKSEAQLILQIEDSGRGFPHQIGARRPTTGRGSVSEYLECVNGFASMEALWRLALQGRGLSLRVLFLSGRRERKRHGSGVEGVTNGVMNVAHFWKQLARFRILEALAWIATHREKRELPGQIAPDALEFNRSFDVSIPAQYNGHFAKYRQPGLRSASEERRKRSRSRTMSARRSASGRPSRMNCDSDSAASITTYCPCAAIASRSIPRVFQPLGDACSRLVGHGDNNRFT